MRKIINHPDRVTSEMIEGFTAAYGKYYRKHPSVNGIISRNHRKSKVALVIGGGGGHEPMFAGFVGIGLADAAACGNIFASPDPNTIYQTAKAVESGKGVLFVYGCYAGDNLNFDMGEEFLNRDGIPTAHVRVQDDVASAPFNRYEDRRGIAGDVFVIKIAGAACDTGADLSEVLYITGKARDNTKSIGVATAPAQLPGMNSPIFELPEGMIEYGMGLHGERGFERTEWKDADVLVETMYRQIMAEWDKEGSREVCVLVNGLGSTTIVELSIVYRKLAQLLDEDGLTVYDVDINQYCTSQEMGGFSITLFQLDEELKYYYDMPCYCPYYAKGSILNEEYVVEDDNTICSEFDTKEENIDLSPAPVVRSKDGELSILSAEDTRNMLLYVANKIIENKPYLTEIDSAIGDGDHGIGMSLGMQKVKRKLLSMKGEKNVYALFEAAGTEMLLSMGGASGVIFGSLYLAGAKGKKPKETLSAKDLMEMEQQSLSAIVERGKASVGDKTMIDALSPAVSMMKESYSKGLLFMLQAAERAAKEGVEATKSYQAKFGRAKSLMERTIGFQDAGATSVSLILEGMREYVEGKI